MSKKPWEDKVSEEESEEVVDADFLDDEDEFEDYRRRGKLLLMKNAKSGFINSSFLTVLLGLFLLLLYVFVLVFYTSNVGNKLRNLRNHLSTHSTSKVVKSSLRKIK
ncbi:MAG: hypothetical protein ACLTOX_02275 [Streptococcus thermophilus]